MTTEEAKPLEAKLVAIVERIRRENEDDPPPEEPVALRLANAIVDCGIECDLSESEMVAACRAVGIVDRDEIEEFVERFDVGV